MFHAIIAWLSGIPVLPPASLIVVVFATIWAIRKFVPSVWLAIERAIPFVDSLDSGPVFTALWKGWQSLPGMLLGATVSALESGLSVKTAVTGVLAGALASIAHEVMAAYRGQVTLRKGDAPPPPKVPSFPAAALALLCCLAHHFTACAVFGSGGSFWPKVAHCAPSPASLVSQVTDILIAGGDYESGLKQLALQDTAEAVECAVKAAVDALAGQVGVDSNAGPAVARGKTFLAKVGQ